MIRTSVSAGNRTAIERAQYQGRPVRYSPNHIGASSMTALDALGFCVNQLCRDHRKSLDEEVAPQLTYRALTDVLIRAYQLVCFHRRHKQVRQSVDNCLQCLPDTTKFLATCLTYGEVVAALRLAPGNLSWCRMHGLRPVQRPADTRRQPASSTPDNRVSWVSRRFAKTSLNSRKSLIFIVLRLF